MDVKKLRILGLSEKEAQVLYLFLMNVGKSIEKKILVKSSDIGENYFGQILTKLVREGLIRAEGNKPRKYKFEVSYLQNFFDQLIENHHKTLSAINDAQDETMLFNYLPLSDEHVFILKRMINLKNKKKGFITLQEIGKNGMPEFKVRRILNDLVSRNFLIKKKIKNRNYFSVEDFFTLKNMQRKKLELEFSNQEQMIEEIILEVMKEQKSRDRIKKDWERFPIIYRLKELTRILPREIRNAKKLLVKFNIDFLPDDVRTRIYFELGSLLLDTYEFNRDLVINIVLYTSPPYDFLIEMDELTQELFKKYVKVLRPTQFEIRVQNEPGPHPLYVLIDGKIILIPLGDRIDQFMFLEDKSSFKLFEEIFYKEWQKSTDLRKYIAELPIPPDFFSLLIDSLRDYPPIDKKQTDLLSQTLSTINGFNQMEKVLVKELLTTKEVLIKIESAAGDAASTSDLVIRLGNILLAIMNKNKDIKIKIVQYIEPPYEYLVRMEERAPEVLRNIIKTIKPDRFEIRIPNSPGTFPFYIILDSSTTIFSLGENRGKMLIIEDPATSSYAELAFHKEWENSIDVRELVDDLPLRGELKDLVHISLARYPPTALKKLQKYQEIMGRAKSKRVFLDLLKNVRYKIQRVGNNLFDNRLGRDYYYDLQQIMMEKGSAVKWYGLFPESSDDFFRWSENMKNSNSDILNFVLDWIKTKRFLLRTCEYVLDLNFCILDESLVVLFYYDDKNNLSKIVLVNEEEIVKNYLHLFSEYWKSSTDARELWSIKYPELKNPILKSYKSLPFQITLPEHGEIRIFKNKDGYLVQDRLVREAKKHIYTMQIVPMKGHFFRFEYDNSESQVRYIQSLTNFLELYMSMKAIREEEFTIRIVHSYSPDFISYLKFIPTKRVTAFFENLSKFYPQVDLRFFPPNKFSFLNFTCYDDYVTHQTGGFQSAIPGRILVIHDDRISAAYQSLFFNGWEESIDYRVLAAAVFKNNAKITKIINNHIDEYPIQGKYSKEDCEFLLKNGDLPHHKL